MNKNLNVIRNVTKALCGRMAFQRMGPEILKAGACQDDSKNSTKTNGLSWNERKGG